MYEHEDQNETERTLSGWLRQVAAAETGGASPAVRERLLEEVRARGRAHRVERMKLAAGMNIAATVKMYALAASLVIATGASVWQLTGRPSVPSSSQAPDSSRNTEVATAFYPLPYSDVPVTRGSIVRLEVSPTALAALGVEPLPAGATRSDVVLADVLVGEDGLARAVRFVRTVANDDRQEQRP